jgi:hypothetical protein
MAQWPVGKSPEIKPASSILNYISEVNISDEGTDTQISL